MMSTVSSPTAPGLLPISVPVEEEGLPGYIVDEYYPVRLGQLLNSRYLVLCKLGCGVGSTVWLAKDQRYIWQ